MSFLIPSFPAYTGPYSVGTQELEVPASELSSTPCIDPAVSTINLRIFYPCNGHAKKSKSVYWLPEPQSDYFRAYARFLQASPWLASVLSYVPLFRTIFHTVIPSYHDPPLLPPTNTNKRYPTLIFSHGLGGSKNAYSHICGSIASHGVVVIAPEHRDGSAPISFVRDRSETDGAVRRVTIDRKSVPYTKDPEVEKQRDDMLRVRCWEIALIHELILRLDKGEAVTNLADTGSKKDAPTTATSTFLNALDVHQSARIAFVGHSFGAATIAQFVKSIYYHDLTLLAHPTADLVRQITPASPLVFLDLWALPMLSTHTSALWARPLPCYDAKQGDPAAPLLSISSEAFFKWKFNLEETIKIIAPPVDTLSQIRPHIFYPIASAHLSQSDFGVLFPWLTKKAFKAEEPERTLRLNTRAILENLRRSGLHVANTSEVDLELTRGAGAEVCRPSENLLGQDHSILDPAEGRVRGWVAIELPKSNGSLAASTARVIDRATSAAADTATTIERDGNDTPDSGYTSGDVSGKQESTIAEVAQRNVSNA